MQAVYFIQTGGSALSNTSQILLLYLYPPMQNTIKVENYVLCTTCGCYDIGTHYMFAVCFILGHVPIDYID